MATKNETYVKKYLREYEDIRGAVNSHPFLFWTVLLIAVLCLAFFFYDKLWGIPTLKEKIAEYQQINNNLNQKVILLETQMAPFKAVALEKYPGQVTEAMAQLIADITRFEKALVEAETKIRGYEVFITVRGKIEWKNGKPPEIKERFWLGDPDSTVSATFEMETKKGKVLVPMFGFKHYSETLENDGSTTIKYKAESLPGGELLGFQPSDLIKISKSEFRLIGVSPQTTDSNIVTVKDVSLDFYFNGKSSYKSSATLNQTMFYPKDESFGFFTTVEILFNSSKE